MKLSPYIINGIAIMLRYC